MKPTRITYHTATLIDNIFFNSIDFHTISGNVVYDLSDHLPNFLIINDLDILCDSKDRIFVRDSSRLNEGSVLNDFATIQYIHTYFIYSRSRLYIQIKTKKKSTSRKGS